MPSSTGKITVLMVDDNHEHVLLCKESLPESEFEVAEAGNGSDALTVLGKNTFDIVALDYAQPDMAGVELLRKLRAKGYGAPVIFVSAAEDPDLSVQAMKLGACDYIVKTFRYYSSLRSRLLENIEACSSER